MFEFPRIISRPQNQAFTALWILRPNTCRRKIFVATALCRARYPALKSARAPKPDRRRSRFAQFRVIDGLIYFYYGVTSANARGARRAQL